LEAWAIRQPCKPFFLGEVLNLVAEWTQATLRAVFRIGSFDVSDGQDHGPMHYFRVYEFVSDEPARFTTLALMQTTKETYGRVNFSSTLYKNINGIVALVDNSPQILLVA
jgi:hypothetical protein